MMNTRRRRVQQEGHAQVLAGSGFPREGGSDYNVAELSSEHIIMGSADGEGAL